MNTSSEITTLLESSKFFLPKYCKLGVKVIKGKQESEFCDCLIQFQNCYIIIQIKEREKNANNLKDLNWYDKSVVKVAKSQIRDTIKFMQDDGNKFYLNSEEIFIDKNKEIIPLIVFDNERITSYKRVIFSNSINMNINFFNINDFKIMLNTIKIPYDIVNYLKYREVLLIRPELINTLLIDNVTESLSLIHKIKSEKDFANHYIASTYLLEVEEDQYIDFYNEIINEIDKIQDPKKDDLLDILLAVNHKLAAQISKKWVKVVDRCLMEGLFKPEYIYLDDQAILLYSKNKKCSEIEFHNYIKNYSLLFAYKHKIHKINVLIFEHYGEQYSVSFSFNEINLEKTKDLDQMVKDLNID